MSREQIIELEKEQIIGIIPLSDVEERGPRASKE